MRKSTLCSKKRSLRTQIPLCLVTYVCFLFVFCFFICVFNFTFHFFLFFKFVFSFFNYLCWPWLPYPWWCLLTDNITRAHTQRTWGNKMAAEISPSTKLCKNILIGVTGSVASVKLSRLVEEQLLLQPKVRLVSYKDNLNSNNNLHRLMYSI